VDGIIDGRNIVDPSLRGAPATKQSLENDCTRIPRSLLRGKRAK